MSKKTQSIYSALDNLDELNRKIEAASREFTSKSLEEIDFQMKMELKNLRFWIGSLYSYNGRSTSRAKKIASKENGKKGGRPPKEITEARRKIAELEDVVIPDLERKIRLSVSAEEEAAFESELKEARLNLEDFRQKLLARRQ